jgi:hypothetical protein
MVFAEFHRAGEGHRARGNSREQRVKSIEKAVSSR